MARGCALELPVSSPKGSLNFISLNPIVKIKQNVIVAELLKTHFQIGYENLEVEGRVGKGKKNKENLEI